MSTDELVIVTGSLDPRKGGQERSILETLVTLAGQQTPLVVLGPDRPPVDGIRFERLRSHDRGSRRTQVRRLLDAALHAIENDPRIVLSYLPVPADLYLPRGGIGAEAYARSSASHGARWRAAVSRVTTSPVRRELLARERALFHHPRSPWLVALSDYVRRSGERHLGLPRDRIRVVPNGVIPSRLLDATPASRSALGIPPEAVVFLAAATNPRLKGVPTLQQVFRSMDPSRARLVLVGAHPRRSTGSVHWLGPRDDVPSLLQMCDAVLHPTFYDPSSRIVLEALIVGLPVVTTVWNGAADHVGSRGWVLPDPKDTASWAEAVERLLDPTVRAALRAGDLNEPAPTMETHAAHLLEVASERRRLTSSPSATSPAPRPQ